MNPKSGHDKTTAISTQKCKTLPNEP